MPSLKNPQPFGGAFNAVQPFFRRRTAQRDASAAIKAEVRHLLGLDNETVVMVNEIACCADDCPDIETIIVVFRGTGGCPPIRIAKAIAETTMDEVRAAVLLSVGSRNP